MRRATKWSSGSRVTAFRATSAVADAWCPTDLMSARAAPGEVRGPDPIAEAYALGFEEGRHEGEVGEQARLRAVRQAAEEALDVIRANEERWSDSLDENIIALSVAVARHIVERELALDPTIVAALVANALQEFPIDQPVRIRVNPNDLLILESGAVAALDDATDGSRRNAHWLADPRVLSGGCVVEGRDRIVDGRVDSALERVYRRFAHQHA